MADATKTAADREGPEDRVSKAGTGEVVRWSGPPIPSAAMLAIFEAQGLTADSRAEAFALIETHLKRQLTASGVQMTPDIRDAVSSRATEFVRSVEAGFEIADYTSAEFRTVAKQMSITDLEQWMHGIRYHYAERVEIDDRDDVKYKGLVSYFITSLEARLESLGADHDEAAKTARDIFRSIRASAGPNLQLRDKTQVDLYLDLITATTLAVQGTAVEGFKLVAGKKIEVPANAKWVDRDRDKFPTAESFLRHHYGPRLGIEGDLTLSEVGRYDTPLLTALDREFKGRRHELHLLLPTVKERADQRLLQKYGYVPQGRDRQSKLTMMRLDRRPVP